MRSFILTLFYGRLTWSLVHTCQRNITQTSRTVNMDPSGLHLPPGVQEGLSQLIPVPSNQYHKGQMGRVCIIGGSLPFVGAAYYAAMSSLKMGADLLYMVCCENAVSSLKAYSPEIMVIPHFIDKTDSVDSIMSWMPRMHSVLIGPGLGTDPLVQQNVKSIIERLRDSNLNIPLILDADALRLLALHVDMLTQLKSPVYLTPNAREEEILSSAFSNAKLTDSVNKWGPNVTLVLKGKSDQIVSLDSALQCTTKSSWRRCGGQGDMVAGSLATLAHYAQLRRKEQRNVQNWEQLAGFAACAAVRKANAIAFEKKGRSMLVTDMLEHYHEALNAVFPSWKAKPQEVKDEC